MSLRIVSVLLAVVALSGQTPKPGSVDGAVTNSVTGLPVKRASVSLRGTSGGKVYNATTDAAGHFHFDDVVPDHYFAVAKAEGYASNVHTARTQKVFAIAAEQQVNGIALEVVPTGAIAGRITDDAGQPLQGILVTAFAEYRSAAFPEKSATTNDLGAYRLIDLQPGSYYLEAIVLPNQAPNVGFFAESDRNAPNVHRLVRDESYPATFYPDTIDASQAASQLLKAGGELAVDFHFRKRPVYHIRGRVITALNSTRGRSVQTQLCDNPRSLALLFGGYSSVDASGAFDIPRLVAGEYCLTESDGSRTVHGPRVTVKDGNVTGVEFVEPPSFTLRGTVTVEGPPLPESPAFTLGFQQIDGSLVTQSRVTSGEFQTPGLMSGSYSIWIRPPPGVYMKSIWYGSQEIPDGVIPVAQEGVPLRITLGTDPAALSVSVSYGTLEPGTPVRVMLLPEDTLSARTDLHRSEPASADGTFSWTGLAPGRYRVIAMESGDSDNLQDSKFRKRMEARFTAVELRGGAQETAKVTVITASEAEKARENLP